MSEPPIDHSLLQGLFPLEREAEAVLLEVIFGAPAPEACSGALRSLIVDLAVYGTRPRAALADLTRPARVAAALEFSGLDAGQLRALVTDEETARDLRVLTGLARHPAMDDATWIHVVTCGWATHGFRAGTSATASWYFVTHRAGFAARVAAAVVPRWGSAGAQQVRRAIWDLLDLGETGLEIFERLQEERFSQRAPQEQGTRDALGDLLSEIRLFCECETDFVPPPS